MEDPLSVKMEMLISEVKKRKVLWSKGARSKVTMDSEWCAVAEITGLNKVTAKNKWRGLRDQFLKEFKKTPVPESGDLDERFSNYRGKWQYFGQLSFLKEIIEFTGQSSEIEGSTFKSELTDKNVEDYYSLSNETPTYKRQRRDVDSDVSADGELSNAGISSNFQLHATEDEDLLFFKSLIPYFKQLDPIQKLRIRSQFQDILIQNLSTQDQIVNPEYKLFP